MGTDQTTVHPKPEITKSRFFICQIALLVAAPTFAAITAHRSLPPTIHLGLATPVLVAELVVLIVALLSGMRPISALSPLKTSTRVAILVWLIAISVGAFAAPYLGVARALLLVMLVHGLFALSLNYLLAGRWSEQGIKLLIAAGWGGFLYCIMTYAILLTARNDGTVNWLYVGVGVSNLRQLAFYGLTCAAIGAGLTIVRGTVSPKLEWVRNFVFLAVGSGMCIWSGGRAAAGALLIVIILAIATTPSPERKRAACFIGCALIVGVVASSIWLPSDLYGLPRILDSTRNTDDGFNGFTSGRIEIWRQTLQLFLERPLFGYGMGQFKFLVPGAEKTFTHPHNSIVQFLFQWGMVGSMAVLVMIYPSIIKIKSAIRAGTKVQAMTAIYLLSGHVAMSMLEGNLYHIYPTSIVILALVVLRNSDPKNGSRDERS